MIEAGAWAGAIARAVAVAIAAVWIASRARPLLSHPAGRLLVLLPLIVPRLFVGYAWANHAPRVALDPVAREFLYPVLLIAFSVPLALLVLALVPPAYGRSARHVARLGPRATVSARARGFLTHPAVPAGALVFVTAFAEFELASLFAIEAWTVALFDAQVGGTPLGTTLAAAIPAAITQAIGLGLFLWGFGGLRREGDGATNGAWRGGWLYAVGAAVLVGVLPCAWVAPDAFAGMGGLATQGSFFRDVAAGVGLAAAAALIADRLAALLRNAPRALWVLALAPGLAGPLVLGLLALWVFQLPGLAWCYDTPLPWLVALSIGLLPFGVILRAGLRDGRGRAVHLAGFLRGPARRRIEWRLVGRRRFVVLGVLFLIAAFETTLASFLAPTGMTSAMTRLYNFMHYGRSAVLAALVGLTIVAPIALLSVGRLIAPRVRWAVPRD